MKKIIVFIFVLSIFFLLFKPTKVNQDPQTGFDIAMQSFKNTQQNYEKDYGNFGPYLTQSTNCFEQIYSYLNSEVYNGLEYKILETKYIEEDKKALIKFEITYPYIQSSYEYLSRFENEYKNQMQNYHIDNNYVFLKPNLKEPLNTVIQEKAIVLKKISGSWVPEDKNFLKDIIIS